MFIEQIHIKNFRSIVDKKFSAKDINIFVGDNDVGKSNVLKALNLFFNGMTDYDTKFDFKKDYSFFAKKIEKTAEEIVISLRFIIPNNFKDKGKKVIWKKTWRIDGEKVDKESVKGVTTRSKSGNWMRKINFRYVPAIKSNLFFSSLLREMYQVFSNTIQRELKNNSKKFIDGIRSHTVPLIKELQDILEIDSELQLPDNLSDLFLILDFSTKVKGTKKEISLKRRGDGVKVRHIPAILKFLADKERVHHTKGDVREDTIWGYEEPENNLELRAAFALAELIKKYSGNIQMFITTHSPVFYRLGFYNEETLAYEVFQTKEKNKNFTDLCRIDCLDEVDDKMGLLPLITPFIIKKETEIQETNKKNEELQNQLNLMDKEVIILVEGKHDKVILENAWKLINPGCTADFVIQNYHDCYRIENVLKREDVFCNDPDKIYIGMLDFDNAYECFERLEKHKKWNRVDGNRETGLSLIHKNKKGGLFLLPVPKHRLSYAGEEYKKGSCLTIELLFEDKVLTTFVKQVEKVGGSKVFIIQDTKKKKFSEKTASFTKKDFKHFKAIFNKISNIIESIQKRDL